MIDTSEETISNHAEELNEKDAVIQSLKEQVFFLQREVEKMQSEVCQTYCFCLINRVYRVLHFVLQFIISKIMFHSYTMARVGNL